jgi:hypothetical protein
MKNFIKWFGIIALAAVIAFSFAACGDDSGGNGGGGGEPSTFTLTDIPDEYNGKYVEGGGWLDEVSTYVVCYQDPDTEAGILISNGRVSIPMWVYDKNDNYKIVRYTGNGNGFLGLNIKNSATEDTRLILIQFQDVTFSNGGATRSWSQKW